MNKNILTFEDACKALNIDTTLPDVSSWPEQYQKRMLAEYKIMRIAEALNEGWQPDWNDVDQPKYYPWFNMQNGFSLCGCGNGYRYSCVGSRLCFKSRELAFYAGEQFLEIYRDFFHI